MDNELPNFLTDGIFDSFLEMNPRQEREMLSVERITEKLDRCYAENDFDGARAVVAYWEEEGKKIDDRKGLLFLANEKMGICRKTADREGAYAAADSALSLAKDAFGAENVTTATTYINAATVYKAFGSAERALPYFEKAKEILEFYAPGDPARLAGLYNNMGLALVDLRRFDEAYELYQKAIASLKKVRHSEGEAAITELNIASAKEAELGGEAGEREIFACLDRASKLLDTPDLPQDGNTAYIYEKCSAVFGYFGRFAYAEELAKRMRKLYEGA